MCLVLMGHYHDLKMKGVFKENKRLPQVKTLIIWTDFSFIVANLGWS